MTDQPEIRELALMLADDIERVCEALNLDIRSRTRRKLICFSPWNSHRNPKLEIGLYPVPGKWNDWIEGQYGDALSLVACCLAGVCEPKNSRNLGAAIRWAKEYFGYEGRDPDQWRRRREEAEAKAARRAAAAARELGEQRRTAKGLWLAAQALTPEDAGWAYLKARGIDLARLPRAPRAVRFSPAQQWFDETGEVRHVGPALMSLMTLANGKDGALHRIWIDPDRPGEKADLSQISDRASPRKMWPSSEGAAIRLWRGESGLSEADAVKQGLVEDIVVCEGVEDGLSIALMTPELRVVAVGSLPGLLAYTPPKIARRIIVAADNDWDKPQAVALLERACRRLSEEFGRAVAVTRSPAGKDFNDLLREA